jgi:hypothetical protein
VKIQSVPPHTQEPSHHHPSYYKLCSVGCSIDHVYWSNKFLAIYLPVVFFVETIKQEP